MNHIKILSEKVISRSTYEGYLTWGYPFASSILDWDFPLQTIHCWVRPFEPLAPHSTHTRRGLVSWRDPRRCLDLERSQVTWITCRNQKEILEVTFVVVDDDDDDDDDDYSDHMLFKQEKTSIHILV